MNERKWLAGGEGVTRHLLTPASGCCKKVNGYFTAPFGCGREAGFQFHGSLASLLFPLMNRGNKGAAVTQ